MSPTAAPEFRGRYSLNRWRRVFAVAAASLALGAGGGLASERLEPWPGRALAPFSLEAIDGHTATLTDHRGAPVLVHYFATWCVPCRRELPALARLEARFPGPQLKILAISVAEPDVRVKRFFQTLPVPFPVLLDRQRAVSKSWEVDVLPTTILLDAGLKPRLFVQGEFDWDSEAADIAIRSLAGTADHQQAQTPTQEKLP